MNEISFGVYVVFKNLGGMLFSATQGRCAVLWWGIKPNREMQLCIQYKKTAGKHTNTVTWEYFKAERCSYIGCLSEGTQATFGLIDVRISRKMRWVQTNSLVHSDTGEPSSLRNPGKLQNTILVGDYSILSMKSYKPQPREKSSPAGWHLIIHVYRRLVQATHRGSTTRCKHK